MNCLCVFLLCVVEEAVGQQAEQRRAVSVSNATITQRLCQGLLSVTNTTSCCRAPLSAMLVNHCLEHLPPPHRWLLPNHAEGLVLYF